MNKIIKKKISEKNIDNLQAFKTFMIEQTVRRIQKVYEKQSIKALLFKIFIVNERFAVNEFINQHVICDLLNALKDEKKCREKDKKLNILNEHHFESQFFNSKKMQTIKIYQIAKNKEKSRKQKNMTEKRAQIIVNKILKNKKKQERALIAAKKRQFNEKRQKTKEIEKQTQNELKFAANKLKQLIIKLNLSFINTKKMNNY